MLWNWPFGLTNPDTAETSGQVSGRLQKQLRPLLQLCGQPSAILSQQWFLGFLNHNTFHLSYLSRFYAQDSLPHNISWIIQVSLYIYQQRYRDNGDGLIDREYILRTLQSRLTSLQYMKNTIYHSQLLVWLTLAELSQIYPICVVPHVLLPSIHRSMQFGLFIIARSLLILSHPVPKLLETKQRVLKNVLRMPCEIQRNVDDGMSAFLINHFTASRNSENGNTLGGSNRVRLDTVEGYNWASEKMHSEAVNERIWKMLLEVVIVQTWRPQSCEFGNALGSRDTANLDTVHLRCRRSSSKL